MHGYAPAFEVHGTAAVRKTGVVSNVVMGAFLAIDWHIGHITG